MTLFTKRNCKLCDQLKEQFDLRAMHVNIEELDADNSETLAHLAWHSLVEVARRTLPILVLDDSTTVSNYSNIIHQLAARANQYGIGYMRTEHLTDCESGNCVLN